MEIKNRFLFSELTAMIADYKFYADNEKEIDNWLWERDSEREGMVIRFCDEKVKMMFMIKWS